MHVHVRACEQIRVCVCVCVCVCACVRVRMHERIYPRVNAHEHRQSYTNVSINTRASVTMWSTCLFIFALVLSDAVAHCTPFVTGFRLYFSLGAPSPLDAQQTCDIRSLKSWHKNVGGGANKLGRATLRCC